MSDVVARRAVGSWIEIFDPSSNDHYYYNKITGENTWDRPAAFDSSNETPPSPSKSSATHSSGGRHRVSSLKKKNKKRSSEAPDWIKGSAYDALEKMNLTGEAQEVLNLNESDDKGEWGEEGEEEEPYVYEGSGFNKDTGDRKSQAVIKEEVKDEFVDKITHKIKETSEEDAPRGYITQLDALTKDFVSATIVNESLGESPHTQATTSGMMESSIAATKESEAADIGKEDTTVDENPFDTGSEADDTGNAGEEADVAEEEKSTSNSNDIVPAAPATVTTTTTTTANINSSNDSASRSKTPPKPPRPAKYIKPVDTAAAQKMLNGDQEQEQDNPFEVNPFATDDTKVSVTTSPTPQSVFTMSNDNKQAKDLPSVPARRGAAGSNAPFPYMEQLKELMLMGFRRSSIERYLREARGSIPVASAQMCNVLKSQQLFVDSQIWRPVLQAKVVAWMPNMVEEGSTDVHTGYVINVAHSLPFPNSWKVTIRFRVFQKFHNEINKFISRALAPDSLRNPFPSSLGGWFKANDDKARNERMKLLGDWLNEVVSTSILCGTPPIWNALCDFLLVKENLILKPPTIAKQSGPLSQQGARKFAGGDLI